MAFALMTIPGPTCSLVNENMLAPTKFQELMVKIEVAQVGYTYAEMLANEIDPSMTNWTHWVLSPTMTIVYMNFYRSAKLIKKPWC